MTKAKRKTRYERRTADDLVVKMREGVTAASPTARHAGGSRHIPLLAVREARSRYSRTE